ncbi:DUF2303 family protein [Mycobacterium sp. 1465703.0]|uniref:DUF2303 family protein n=1 Tax=Mycobacterium sp. 1465703.0 TaxID=1834078 RepID=UPI0018D33010|nr:DUF2303 family protein [Mycobacterium sp. 1465703.0]
MVNTPHPADVLDDPRPYVRHVVSVTEKHGLQHQTIEVPASEVTKNPFRPIGERVVADLDSFLAELDRRPLGDAGTLWGNATAGRLTAIYNDHRCIGDDGDDLAGWRDDKLTLKLVTDEDWAAWHNISGTYFGQTEFGDKIESLLHTIVDPDQADLLEIIDSVRASTSGAFESTIERGNGGQTLTYKQEHTMSAGKGRQLELPQLITLELRPWEGHHETTEVQAYFRTRVKDGALGLAVKLKPTRQIVRDAWTAVALAVTAQTGKTVLAVSS